MKEFVTKNKENIIIMCISVIAFITGCFAIGCPLSLAIIGLADLLLILPTILTTSIRKKTTHKINEKGEYKENTKPERKKKKEKIKVEPKRSEPKGKENRKRKIKLILKVIIVILFILFIIGIIFCCLFWAKIVNNAPKFDSSLLYQKESSIIYDMNGVERKKLGTEKRENVTYDELPEVLINAIIATEDSRFFQHNGFDLPRFAKASIQAILGQDGGGASTLTMQVSKNTYTSKEVTLERKFTDIYMSIFEIEKNYTKQEILEFYVNYSYLGGGAYGVELACQNYFGKSVKDINLAEAALIAGLFQSPGGYDPYVYPQRAEERRQIVLKLMERHGYITADQRKQAAKITVDRLLKSTVSSNVENYTYQSFIDNLSKEVYEDTGWDPNTVPLEIYSTMDPDKQEYVYKIMTGENFTWENDVVDAGIAVVDVKSGAILALGGGRQTEAAKNFNHATKLNNQIGSTSKPLFDYATGIEYENWSTYTPFVDEPYTYSDGTPINNWDGQYKGWMTAREALAQSRNIPALKAFQGNKNSNIKQFVTGLGLHPEVDTNGRLHEAHAIGGYTGECPLTMAAAYAAFANKGMYTKPYSYTKVIRRDTGEVYEKHISKNKAMSKETAYMMTSMLQSAAQYGLGKQADINGAVFGAKTGTSNFDAITKQTKGLRYDAVNDLWVSGISPDYAISVWYGYDDIDPNYTNTVNTIQHRKLFQAVGRGIFKSGGTFEKSDGVVEVQVEKGTNPVKLASDKTPSDLVITELFKKGYEPQEISTKYIQLSNITNLKGTVKDTELTLTWNAVDKQKDAEENWGNIVYKVYSEKNGQQKLIDTVTTTTTKITISPDSADTYVIKTAYQNYSGNMSNGARTTITLPKAKEITISLKGDTAVALSIGETFTDPGFVVKEGDSDVTKSANVNKTILDTTSGKNVTTINTNIANTYTITYVVSYKGTSKTLTRTVVITPASTSTNNSSSNTNSSSSSNSSSTTTTNSSQ